MSDPRASGRTDYSNNGMEKGSTYGRRKCPACKQTFGNLPHHLRECPER